MTARDLVLVPLDDRPCCRQFPARLAALAGHSLTQPPRRLLGSYLDPGQPDLLLDWLEQRLGPRTSLVLSLDMLAWGGLVASRRTDLPAEPALRRLERAASLARTAPAWAFSTVMRTAPTQTSVEEVERATRLVELATWMARAEEGRPGAAERAQALRQAMPGEWVESYLQARRRHHELNKAALEHCAAGDFRFVLLGIDDSRTEGLNVREAALLHQAISRLGAPAAVAPGTDEMAMLLLVRVLAPGQAVAIRWSREVDRARVTRYEDRALEAVVEAQARAAGLDLRDEAPRQVWVYGPYGPQPEAAGQGRPRRSRRAAQFAEALARELERGTRIAVADVARANGGDLALVRELLDQGILPRLAGYAGWNTAGNTLGTALATAALFPERPTVASERERLCFLLERVADDVLYQAGLRQALSAPLGGSFVRLDGARLESARRDARTLLTEELRRLFRRHFADLEGPGGPWRLARISVDLPWPRTFEVDVEVALQPTHA